MKVSQSCLTLCDYTVHGILQARKLEWVATPSSRGSSPPRDRTRVSCIGRRILYPLSHLDAPSLIDSSRLTGELQEFRKHLGTLSKPEATARLSVCCFSASVSLSFPGGSRFFPGIYTNVWVSLFPPFLLFASVFSLTHTQPIKHTDEHTGMLTYSWFKCCDSFRRPAKWFSYTCYCSSH